jgi:hypothetical protein
MQSDMLGPGLAPKPLDHFRKLYMDTTTYSNTPALMCVFSFFGADRLLFRTDGPLRPQYGHTPETIASVEKWITGKRKATNIHTKYSGASQDSFIELLRSQNIMKGGEEVISHYIYA